MKKNKIIGKIDLEEIFKKNYIENKSLVEIAKEYNVSYQALLYYMKKYKLPLITRIKNSEIKKSKIFENLKELKHKNPTLYKKIAEYIDKDIIEKIDKNTKNEIFDENKLKIQFENLLTDIGIQKIKNAKINFEKKYLETDNLIFFVMNSDFVVTKYNYYNLQNIKKFYKDIFNLNKNVFIVTYYEIMNPIKYKIVKNILEFKLFNKHKNIVDIKKVKIKKVENNSVKDFYNEHHLFGFNDTIKYHNYVAINMENNEILAAISLQKSRYKDEGYELYRYCVNTNIFVNNIFGKLLNFAIDDIKPKNIITYASKRLSNKTNNVYVKNGFKYVNETNFSYSYIDANTLKEINRMNLNKKKQEKIFENFDKKLSEIDNALNNGYYLYVYPGQYKFAKTL